MCVQMGSIPDFDSLNNTDNPLTVRTQFSTGVIVIAIVGKEVVGCGAPEIVPNNLAKITMADRIPFAEIKTRTGTSCSRHSRNN